MTTGSMLDTGILCRKRSGATLTGFSGRGRRGDAPRKSPSSGTGAGCPLGVPRKAAQTAPNRLRFLRSGARGRRAPQKHPTKQRHTLIQNPPNAMYQKRRLKRSPCVVYFWAEKAPNMYHLETENPPRQPSKSGFPVVFQAVLILAHLSPPGKMRSWSRSACLKALHDPHLR